ncbi:hypothetical protein [Companilactobacillus metriopterae]|uniref:hypothetical protein n=1 Tax=Companilactobacillus metriopterae TaxID=1909267 RepID=UPI00100AAC93|nr:hypothetical protein [Companilactobacillus metriopterae]
MEKNQAQVLGDKDVYEISPEIKKYALLDVGFRETKQKNFRLERPISGDSPYNAKYTLKVNIDKDFTTLKMNITDKSGLHNLDIFKVEGSEPEIQDFHYQTEFMIEKNILIKK